MPWSGSCNRCGHCGCYEHAGEPEEWYPGIGGYALPWYKQHPSEGLALCQLLNAKFVQQSGRDWDHDYGVSLSVQVQGIGNITCYISRRGIQKSATDASCPFFRLGSPNECLLWGRPQLPPHCLHFPDNMGDDWNDSYAARWSIEHPHTSQGGPCGFLWTEP
jgi:hypothetical protein